MKENSGSLSEGCFGMLGRLLAVNLLVFFGIPLTYYVLSELYFPTEARDRWVNEEYWKLFSDKVIECADRTELSREQCLVVFANNPNNLRVESIIKRLDDCAETSMFTRDECIVLIGGGK